jgi:hypothetical protein
MTSIFTHRVNIFLLFFVLATFLLARTSIASSPSPTPSEPEPIDFLQLLNSVPSDRLHAVLHDYEPGRYKHGVFREDRTAMEAVHRDDAAKATKLVRIAKRQVIGGATGGSTSGNGTFTTSTVSTTPASISSTTTTDVLSSTLSTIVEVSTSTSYSTIPSSTSSSTSSVHSTTLMTTITTAVLKTSTFPNGARSTVTEITVIGVPLPNAAQPTKSSNTQTGSPSLQTNGAAAGSQRFKTGVGVLVGGAVAGFWFL